MPKPPPLRPVAILARLAVIGGVTVCAAAAFAYTGGWLSPGRLTQARIIDRFQAVNGTSPGFRRNHAKGLCATGFFESNGAGVRLSRAVVFQPGRVPVVGRFADAVGKPFLPDSPGFVRSLALRFALPDGEEWRTGMNDIPVFSVDTPRAFYDQLLAMRPDPATGKPDPARVKAFFAAYPASAKAVHLIQQRPFSTGFDNASYNSLDAFRFVNAAGVSTPVRWSMASVQPYVAQDPAAAPQDKNYLFDALIARVQQTPLQWHLLVTIGQPGDPTNDATIPWPADRETVDVGTLTIDHVEGEDTGACRDITFDPLVLPDGIAPSDDPLLSARSAAYSTSLIRRDGEPKSPSAVRTAQNGAAP